MTDVIAYACYARKPGTVRPVKRAFCRSWLGADRWLDWHRAHGYEVKYLALVARDTDAAEGLWQEPLDD